MQRWKMQVLKTQVRICNGGKRKYSNLKSILKSLRFSSLAFSVDPLPVGLDQFTCTVPDRCYTQEIGLMLDSSAEGPGFKNRSRVTVLGELFTPQAAKLVAVLLRVARVTAGLAESNGSLPPGLWLTSPAGWLPRTGINSGTLQLRNPTFGNRVLATFTFLLPIIYVISEKKQSAIHLPNPLENAPH